MKKTVLVYIILVLISFSCIEHVSDKKNVSDVPSQTIKTNGEKFILDTNKIVILPIDTSVYSIPTYVRTAELTNQELAEVEQLLHLCLAPKKLLTKEDLESQIILSEYRRQYIAYINQKGEKLVWVNCFCEQNFNDWKKAIVRVMDGGRCFFNVKINLTRKTFEDLMINGVG